MNARRLGGVLLALALAGCPDSQPQYATVDEARAAVVAARDSARAAREAKDPETALAAAERAGQAFAVVEASAPDAATVELRAALREAKGLAQETDERARLEAQLAGLKARAYRSVRGAALTATFKGLALAAREADARGVDALPEPVRDAALQAATWAESVNGRAPKADGSKDWKGIAADMDALAATPPVAVGVTLGVGFTALGKTGLALFETEALDLSAVADPTTRLSLHLLRGFARNNAGYKRLAVLEVEAGLDGLGLLRDANGTIGGGPVELTADEVIGSVHLFLAVVYLDQKDYAAADRELALAVVAWPDNPVSTYLTGELQLATGERQRAAESLEASAKGSGEDAEWLAARIAARTRAIRDGEEDAEAGLVGDPVFLTRLALTALWKAADRSPQAGRARAEVERARAFCGDLLGQLPGFGEDAGGDTAPVESR